MLDHLSIQCADVASSKAFYAAVLAPLGGAEVMAFGEVTAYGVGEFPTFWLGPLTAGEPNREVRDPDGNNVEAVCHTPEP